MGVYISHDGISPADFIGGTWTAITGKFLYANAGNGTGGSNTHTHTYGVRTHEYYGNLSVQIGLYNGSSWIAGTTTYASDTSGVSVNGNTSKTKTEVSSCAVKGATTNTSSNSSMPAYQEIYAWYRTA